MAKLLVAHLLDRQILLLNPLATVMDDCVVIRDTANLSHIILGLSHLTGLKRHRTTHPGLLVIAAGLSLVAAAAYASHEQNAAWIVAILAAASAASYFLSRRESVTFISGRYSAETDPGTLSQASKLISAVHQACEQLIPAAEPQPFPAEPALEPQSFAEAA